MKRKDRKKLGHQPHSQPDSTSTADQKRSITGDVHVRGEVTVQLTPEEIFTRETQTDEKNTRERKRWWLEIATFIVVTCYAGLTFWQGYSSQKSADAATSAALTAKDAAQTARDALNLSDRSWLETRLAAPWEEAVKHGQTRELLGKLRRIIFPFEFTNIGHVPVKDIHVRVKVELLDRDQGSLFDYQGRYGTVYDSVLYPTRTDDFSALLFAPGKPPSDRDAPAMEMSPTLRVQLEGGEKYLVAYGQGTFEDDLGKHWFKFCRWITFSDPKTRQKVASRGCVDYNDFGDVDQQKQSK